MCDMSVELRSPAATNVVCPVWHLCGPSKVSQLWCHPLRSCEASAVCCPAFFSTCAAKQRGPTCPVLCGRGSVRGRHLPAPLKGSSQVPTCLWYPCAAEAMFEASSHVPVKEAFLFARITEGLNRSGCYLLQYTLQPAVPEAGSLTLDMLLEVQPGTAASFGLQVSAQSCTGTELLKGAMYLQPAACFSCCAGRAHLSGQKPCTSRASLPATARIHHWAAISLVLWLRPAPALMLLLLPCKCP